MSSQIGNRGAPPHARGWTRTATAKDGGAWGSPARAGMDRPGYSFAMKRRRLPRTRGDGPQPRRLHRLAYGAPPHARGWTGGAGDRRGGEPGSPARAGMDRLAFISDHPRTWLPRTRGDGPHRRRRCCRVCSAPPHARGWTHGSTLPLFELFGSPARAGMDRGAACHAHPDLRLPRTRGDGPHLITLSFSPEKAPPHARGWTRDVWKQTGTCWGSPARAGMDRKNRGNSRDRVGLPRTRGDGPRSSMR